MNELIAVCPNKSCGHIFQPNNISGTNAQIVVGQNNVGVKCPNCGQVAYLNEGVYSIQQEAIRLLSGPRESFEQLQRIKKLLENSAKAVLSKEEVLKQVADESPRIAALLKNANGDTFQKWLTQSIAIVGLAVAMYATFKSNDDKDEEVNKLFIKHLQTELNEALQRTNALQNTVNTYESVNLLQEQQVHSNDPVYVSGKNIELRGLHLHGPLMNDGSVIDSITIGNLTFHEPPVNTNHTDKYIAFPVSDAQKANLLYNIRGIIEENNLSKSTLQVVITHNSLVSQELMNVVYLLRGNGYKVEFTGVRSRTILGDDIRTGISFTGIPAERPTRLCLILNKN